jgi:energy-coupling factor transporter ATP-binding protein EcfA2
VTNALRESERGWLRLVVPRDNTSAPFTAEQLYAAIHAGTGPRQWTQIVLAGTATDVGIWIRAETERLDPLGAMVRATYPDAELERTPPDLPDPSAGGASAGARWQLVNEAAYPIKTVRAFEHSEPMAMTLGALAEARPGECGAVSLVLTPAPPRFARRSLALTRALVTGGDVGPLWQRAAAAPLDVITYVLNALLQPSVAVDGGAFTSDADLEARVKWIAGKAAQPAFRVTIRTAWLAATAARAAAGHAGLVSALGQFAVVGQNALSARATASNDAWAPILAGTPARRERVVLAIDELAGLVHCPGPELVVPHLRRTRARRRAAAATRSTDALHLADTAHRDSADPVGVTVTQLMSHGYLVGPSGTGKTTLLTTLVLALAEADTGAVVLDPHGDLARQALLRLPDDQLDRLLLFDLAEPANLPTLNPLWVPPAPADELAVSRAVRSAAVTAVFADVWGLHRATAPNLMHFLEAAIAALVASGEGCLAVLPRFLTDGAYRAGIVRAANDPRLSARWAEFAALSTEDRSRTVRAILNKAADFDRNPLLGTVFGDPGPGLRLDEVMDSGRLLVVSLPRGLVPEGTVELIGSLMVSLLYQAALAREARPADQRPPVVAVIDEFQEFALSTFAKVVTATRKYGLGLVVANQNLSRVRSVSPDVLATLLANAGTIVTFRTAPGDADVLAPMMAPFTADDLVTLAPYECYWRIPDEAGPQVVSARTRPLLPPVRSDDEAAALAARVRVPGRPLMHAEPRAEWQ